MFCNLNIPKQARQFSTRCDVWDVIMAHIDELDVDEMRAALEDVVFEYHEYCGAGKRDA